jgi:hypothetical protein
LVILELLRRAIMVSTLRLGDFNRQDASLRLRQRRAEANEQRDRRLDDLAPLLRGDDRILVELTHVRRLPVRQVGPMLGLSPGQVTRRLQSVRRRLDHPIVQKITDQRISDRYLDPGVRRIAIDFFLNKARLRDLAREHGLTVAGVRAHLRHVRGWAQGQDDAVRTLRSAMTASGVERAGLLEVLREEAGT